jgi:hypothetical protein
MVISSSAANVNLWKLEEYVGEDTQLPMLVPLAWISGQLILKQCQLVLRGQRSG